MSDLPSPLPPNVSETVVTVGTFDGVHRGHQDVLRRLTTRAGDTGLVSVLVTFDPHPLEVVNPTAARPLLTVGVEKSEVLAESEIDYCVVVPFTTTLARYSPEQFFELVLHQRYRMRELISGYDNGFGRGRSGDVETLRTIGARRGVRVEVVPPATLDDGRPISSTAIRRAIAGGDLDGATRQLGRPYSISGRVAAGAQRGRGLGYPTINVPMPSPRKLLPPEGVYAVRAQTPDGSYDGMLNLGPRPTFGEHAPSIEAHLFDGSGNWYGAPVRIDFIARLRDVQTFDGPAALAAQLARDERHARALLRRALTRPFSGHNLGSHG